VPIAEQNTKDSVGKENGMNLSDHESSESDGLSFGLENYLEL
jgi:hypothetical protein